MKKSIVCVLAVLMLFCLMLTPSVRFVGYAKDDEVTLQNITSKSALLLDFGTGNVIFEKNAHERLPIASMTKLATLSIVFDSLNKGLIKENDMVTISENAAAVEGSSAFLDAGSSYKVNELIKSVIVASANDSSVALAEYVSGSEDVCVSKMNKLAVSLGLEDTNFVNCTGLPAENHYSSAYDMAKIYMTMCDNAIYRKYSKIWMEDFIHPSGRKTGLVNTNRLVKTFDGIEGGKTGYTDAAKYCLTASAKRGNMRLIGVVIGANDSKTRFAEMTKMLSFGFANYQSKLLVNSEVPVTIQNFKNAKSQVEIYAEHDCYKFLPKADENTYTTDFQIYEVKAPLNVGDVVGKMFVFDKNNMVVDEVNLIVKEKVEANGIREYLDRLVHLW